MSSRFDSLLSDLKPSTAHAPQARPQIPSVSQRNYPVAPLPVAHPQPIPSLLGQSTKKLTLKQAQQALLKRARSKDFGKRGPAPLPTTVFRSSVALTSSAPPALNSADAPKAADDEDNELFGDVDDLDIEILPEQADDTEPAPAKSVNWTYLLPHSSVLLASAGSSDNEVIESEVEAPPPAALEAWINPPVIKPVISKPARIVAVNPTAFVDPLRPWRERPSTSAAPVSILPPPKRPRLEPQVIHHQAPVESSLSSNQDFYNPAFSYSSMSSTPALTLHQPQHFHVHSDPRLQSISNSELMNRLFAPPSMPINMSSLPVEPSTSASATPLVQFQLASLLDSIAKVIPKSAINSETSPESTYSPAEVLPAPVAETTDQTNLNSNQSSEPTIQLSSAAEFLPAGERSLEESIDAVLHSYCCCPHEPEGGADESSDHDDSDACCDNDRRRVTAADILAPVDSVAPTKSIVKSSPAQSSTVSALWKWATLVSPALNSHSSDRFSATKRNSAPFATPDLYDSNILPPPKLCAPLHAPLIQADARIPLPLAFRRSAIAQLVTAFNTAYAVAATGKVSSSTLQRNADVSKQVSQWLVAIELEACTRKQASGSTAYEDDRQRYTNTLRDRVLRRIRHAPSLVEFFTALDSEMDPLPLPRFAVPMSKKAGEVPLDFAFLNALTAPKPNPIVLDKKSTEKPISAPTTLAPQSTQAAELVASVDSKTNEPNSEPVVVSSSSKSEPPAAVAAEPTVAPTEYSSSRPSVSLLHLWFAEVAKTAGDAVSAAALDRARQRFVAKVMEAHNTNKSEEVVLEAVMAHRTRIRDLATQYLKRAK